MDNKVTKFEGMIAKIARKWISNFSDLDYDDMMQNAWISVLKHINAVDEKKGSASTYMWYAIDSSIKDYIRKEMRYLTRYQEEYNTTEKIDEEEDNIILSTEDNTINIDQKLFIENLLLKLDESAKEVLNIILNDDDIWTRKRSRKSILDMVEQKVGRSIKRDIKNIKLALCCK